MRSWKRAQVLSTAWQEAQGGILDGHHPLPLSRAPAGPRSEQPCGDPGPRGGAAAEETLLRLQQVVPARGQHLGCSSCPLWPVYRAAH